MRKHGVEIGEILGALFLFGRQTGAAVIHHLHVKAARPAGEGLANPAHAEDADALAADARAQKVALPDAVAPALAHDPVILDPAPRTPPSSSIMA